MDDQTIVKMRRGAIVASALGGIAILLLCATFFAKQYIFWMNLLLALTAVATTLILVGLCRMLTQSAEKEKKNRIDSQLLDSFTTNQFVQRHGDLVKKTGKKYAFLSFALLDFELYNEDFGRAAGDEMLVKVCRILQQMQKPDDQFARCFGVQFEGLFAYENEAEITDFIDRLQSQVSKLKFAFGISPVTNPRGNLHVCEEKAQSALKAARASDKPYEFVREIDREQLRQIIVRDMNQALADNEFVMYLQPRYDLRTGKICGAEALVRWIKKDGTVLFPQDMIGIFEETGFITKLDMVILKQACIKIRKWIDKGYTPLPISINISKLHILDATFINGLSRMIKEYRVPTDILEFDISQTSISVKMDKLLDLNRQFDGRELMVVMDESGGNSSIKILESLPGDTVKLGGDFFNIARQSPKVYDAISKVIDLFYKKNVKVIAESIETEEQVELLKRLNCHVAQGFYFSRPVSPAQFDKIAFEPATVK